MIDLNDVWQPPVRYDLDEVRERLCATAADWLPPLFPHARHVGRPQDPALRRPVRPSAAQRGLLRHSPARPARRLGLRSCDRRMRRSDRPDPSFDRAHQRRAVRGSGPARASRSSGSASIRRPQQKPTTATRSLAFSPAAQPLAGSVAEVYLQSRGLRDPASPDLLFNPDLADFETRRGWPGMVAIVRDGAGAPTGGIHRTYLLDDGSGKAPPGKKMLGAVAGGSVRLSSVGRGWSSRHCRRHRDGALGTKRSSGSRPGPRCPPTGCAAGSGRTASIA